LLGCGAALCEQGSSAELTLRRNAPNDHMRLFHFFSLNNL
jgi:hypothetical protein